MENKFCTLIKGVERKTIWHQHFCWEWIPSPPSSKKVHPYTFDKEQLTPVHPNFVRFVKSCQALSEILDFSLKSKYIQSGTLIHFTLLSQASSEISFEKATRTPFSWAKESKTLLKTSRVSWPAFPEREQHSPNTVLNDPPFFSHTLVVSFITFTAVSCISFFLKVGERSSLALSSFRVLVLFTDFGETSCWNWFSENGVLFGFGERSCWNWFSGNGTLFGFGGLGVLGGVGGKHVDILPVNALIHDTIIWKSSEWINGCSSSDFWRRIPSTRPKAEAT